MKGVGRMTEVLHPGLILILTAFIALAAPYALRAAVMLAGTAASVYAAFNLPAGTDLMLPVVDNIVINYLHADKLSLIFTLIFSIMAFIGAVYSLHNKSRMEALCSMSYAGCAIGVTLAGDWITLIFFWEALAVSSLFLIWGAHTEKARTAGFRYLLVHFFGELLLSFAVYITEDGGAVGFMPDYNSAFPFAFYFSHHSVAVRSAFCHTITSFLQHNTIPHNFYNIQRILTVGSSIFTNSVHSCFHNRFARDVYQVPPSSVRFWNEAYCPPGCVIFHHGHCSFD